MNSKVILTSCRIDGRAVPVAELRRAIADRHGVSVDVIERPEGLGLITGTWQGLNALRRALVADGYQVLTASMPDTTDHLLIVRDPPAGWRPPHMRMHIPSYADV